MAGRKMTSKKKYISVLLRYGQRSGNIFQTINPFAFDHNSKAMPVIAVTLISDYTDIKV